MTETSRPAPLAVRLVLGAVLVAGLTTLVVGEVRAHVRGPERQVAVPAVHAGPEEVVRAFVDALDARDVDTAKALTTPEHAAQTRGAVDSWYVNVESIKNLEIRPPFDDPVAGYADAVFVPVYFDLRQRREVSMENGRTRWGYQLVRRTPADRWLVAGEGPI